MGLFLPAKTETVNLFFCGTAQKSARRLVHQPKGIRGKPGGIQGKPAGSQFPFPPDGEAGPFDEKQKQPGKQGRYMAGGLMAKRIPHAALLPVKWVNSPLNR